MNKFFRIIFLTAVVFTACNTAFSEELLRDEFIETTLKSQELEPVKTNVNYNYEDTYSIPIKLRIQEPVSTKKGNIYDGQVVTFKVKQNVKYNKKVIIEQGTIIPARVALYSTKGMNGIPASIVIEDFKVPDIDNNKIKGSYIKKGLSLTLFVMPLKWALTPIPGVGSLTNFIMGCNSKITPKDDIIIYYYPNWPD